MQPHIIDLSPLLKQIEREIAEADRALHVAQIRLANLQGQHRGVLRAVEQARQQLAPPTPIPPTPPNEQPQEAGPGRAQSHRA